MHQRVEEHKYNSSSIGIHFRKAHRITPRDIANNFIVLKSFTDKLKCFFINCNFEKDRESNGEGNAWCETNEEKEDRGPNRDVGIEGNSGSDGKGEWSDMYGHVLRRDDGHVFEKSVGV